MNSGESTSLDEQVANLYTDILYQEPPALNKPDLKHYAGLSPYEPPQYSTAWLVLEPALVSLGLYTPPDPTYGRYLIPPLAEEKALDESPLVETTRRRVFTDAQGGAENVRLTAEEVDRARGRAWIYTKMWEAKERRGVGVGVDIVIVHGIGDYGSRWSVHVNRFIANGFRVICPDLPAHGHSTGTHAHIPSTHLLTHGLRLVLNDLTDLDVRSGREKSRKTFLCGASLGAFVALSYFLEYPPEKPENFPFSGAFLMCPLIEIAPETRPSKIVEYIARALSSFAGRVPLAQAQRGKGHPDPRVEISFLLNPQAYHGALRIATGLAIVQGLIDLAPRANEIHLPIKAIHGAQDRITNPRATEEFFSRISSTDKAAETWEGYEHVMNKVGYDREDDKPRQKVLEAWYQWITERI